MRRKEHRQSDTVGKCFAENANLKELRERGYNGVADEIAQALKHWNDGFKRSRASIRENYLIGECGLHVHISVWINRDSGITEDYCAYFQFSKNADDAIKKNLDVHGLTSGKTIGGSARSSDASRRFSSSERQGCAHCKHTMLVDSVQFVNQPEGMGTVIPSVMWLQSLDNCPCRRSDATYLFSFGCPVHRTTMKDREFGTSDLAVGHFWHEGSRQAQCQMVESGPEIENAVAKNQTKTPGDRSCLTHSKSATLGIDMDGIRRSFRILFVDDYVGVALDPSLGVCLKAMEMFACPINFKGEAVSH